MVKGTTRRFVVGGLLAAQLLTVLVIVIATGRITERAEADHTAVLLDRAAAEAADHTRDYLAPAAGVVSAAADLIDGGEVDPRALERLFVGELQRSPQLSGVYVGGDDGSFFFVSRAGDGYLVKEIGVAGGERTVGLRGLTADGVPLATDTDPTDTFDPRLRPWYQDAVRGGSTDVAWTEPYTFFTSEALGLSASAAVETAADMFVVVGADIELDSLSSFLHELRIGETGRAVIVDDAGTVLAHPDGSVIPATDTAGPALLNVADLADARGRAAVASMISAGTDAGTDATTFAFDDGSGQAAFRTLDLGSQAWTIAVHADEGALVQTLSDARADERLLMVIVGLVSAALLGALAFPATRSLLQLERRATFDQLTGLLNRGTILSQGAQVAEQPAMHAAVMVDLDHFKLINDTHGHPVGDEVIHAVGRRIAASVRPEDLAGRIGGEEFLVVLQDTTSPEALEIAERIRHAIRSEPVGTTIGQLEITASVGLGIAIGPAELQRTLAVADTALMEAKHDGRDRLVSGGMANDLVVPGGSRAVDA